MHLLTHNLIHRLPPRAEVCARLLTEAVIHFRKTELRRPNIKRKSSSRRIRPTTSRTRAALISILGPTNIEGSRCADLFAGTGSVGMDLLRRGAAHVDFVETNRSLVTKLESELHRLRFSDRADVHRSDATRWNANGGHAPYDIVFADPPYETTDLDTLMDVIATSGMISLTATVVIEHSSRIEPPKPHCSLLRHSRTRVYGDSALSIYHPKAPD